MNDEIDTITAEAFKYAQKRAENIGRSVEAVSEEAIRATMKYPPFRSYHEGYAIIKEELEELWEEIKKKPANRDHEKIYREAMQVAAMAIRFMVDLKDYGGN